MQFARGSNVNFAGLSATVVRNYNDGPYPRTSIRYVATGTVELVASDALTAPDAGKAASPVTVNGFTVLDYRADGMAEGYALCDRGHEVHDRFVTWAVFLEGTWKAYSGHYHSDLRTAVSDLYAR